MSSDDSLPLHSTPLGPEKPSPQDLALFAPYPWTQNYLSSSRYRSVANNSRRPRTTTHEIILWRTLNTPSTISAWRNFQCKRSTPEYPYGHFVSLLKLESDVNGHEDVAHGGFLGILLDEIIGTACEFDGGRRVLTMTAYLNIGFKRPVATPGVVLLRGWVEKREGRKTWGRGTIEDGEGNVLTTGRRCSWH